ncbi:MAG TPA: hypothetical protein VHZ09_15905 [Acidobacteriaceae bacterium]|jgi:hypothetical protein|nr:hypothetical protein [Acidobacteriaceae bacterium]
MRKSSVALTFALALLTASPFVLAQNEGEGQGQAIITALPKQNNAPPADIPQQDVVVQVNGKKTEIANWQALRGPNAPVELVILIDDGARASLGREFDDITHFVQSLPPNVKIAFAYMENGRAVMSAPLSADHAKVLQQIHLPIGGAGISASPYFCLSDLAKRWPSEDRTARREVVMISDGVDRYELRYDPDDPYVHAAIDDSARAGLVVYSIYWRGDGRVDRSGYENNAGQNLLLAVTQATGGNSYWEGMGNPVTLQPYFEDLSRRLNNQFELGFTAPLHGKAQVESLKVKVNDSSVKVTAPQQAYVAPGGTTAQR